MTDKVKYLDEYKPLNTVINKGDGQLMRNSNYNKSLSDSEVDLKIERAINPVKIEISEISNKIDRLPVELENLILKEREYQRKERAHTNQFIYGTVVIGIISILIGIASLFVNNPS